MKIGYVVISDLRQSIARKVLAQTRALAKIPGCETALYNYSHSVESPSLAELADAQYFYLATQNPHPYLRALAFRRKVFTHLLQVVEQDKLDVLYIRGTPSDPFVERFVERCKAKVVFEINSIQASERKMQKRPWVAWFEEFFTRRALQKASGFVGVSSSVQQYYAELINDSVPSLILGNGFEVESVALRRQPVFDGTHVRLISTANYAKWHGLDRVLRGLAVYQGRLSISIAIVGTGKTLNDLKKQVNSLGLSKQVFFIGEAYGKELDGFFDQSHLAIAALAVHRIRLKDATSIKVREYLSRGIPFLISYSDIDLKAVPFGDHYCFIVPPDDSPIDFSFLEVVAPTVFTDSELPARMRRYAIEHVDMREKMRILHSFLGAL